MPKKGIFDVCISRARACVYVFACVRALLFKDPVIFVFSEPCNNIKENEKAKFGTQYLTV